MKVNIVGASFLGISLGINLLQRGYTVNIFEKKSYIGGKFKPFVSDNYCDAGTNYNIISLKYKKMYEKNIFKDKRMKKIDIYKVINFKDKSKIEIKCGEENIKKLLTTLAESKNDKNIVNEIFQMMNLMRSKNRHNNIMIKAKSNIFNKIIKFFCGDERTVNDYKKKTVDDFLHIIDSEKLKEVLKSLANKKASFLFLIEMLNKLAFDELYLIEDSIEKILESLMNKFNDLGGKVFINSNIEEIYIGSKDVIISDKINKNNADIAIIATDNIKNILGIIDEQYINTEIEKLLSFGSIFDSYTIINFVLKNKISKLNNLERFIIEKPFIDNAQAFQRKYETIYRECKEKYILSLYMRGNYSYWEKESQNIEEIKELITKKCIIETEKYLSHFEKNIKLTSVITPIDKFKENNVMIGSTRGWISTPKYYNKNIEILRKNSKVFAAKTIFNTNSRLEKTLDNLEFLLEEIINPRL